MVNDMIFESYFDDLRECVFVKDLIDKIECGLMVAGNHVLSDWLDSLSDIEIEYLMRVLDDVAPCEFVDCDDMDDCEKCGEMCNYDFEVLIPEGVECDYDLVEMLFLIKTILAMESKNDTFWHTLCDGDYQDLMVDLTGMVCLGVSKRFGETYFEKFSLIDGGEGINIKLDDKNHIPLSPFIEKKEPNVKYGKNHLSKRLRDFFDSEHGKEK